MVKYVGMQFINFRDYDFSAGGNHCFQWADVRTFEIDRDIDNGSIISQVIGAVEYRDDYVGGGIDPEGVRHGPYWLSSISPMSFDVIGKSSAADVFRQWVGNCGTTPSALAQDLDQSVLRIISQSDAIYALKELDGDAINDYGNLHMEFHELIAINRNINEAALIVLTDD